MKTSATVLWTATLACMLAGSPSFAQPSGLRLDGGREGFTLRDTDNGLHLRFTTLPQPAASSAGLVSDENNRFSTRNTLRADLPVLSKGMHTSLGLSWDGRKQSTFSSKSSPSPTTFMGLGWNSEPSRSSRWALSAEVGTNISGSYGCFGAVQGCSSTRPMGLSNDAVGNGLRLNPYVSFGATYSFDR